MNDHIAKTIATYNKIASSYNAKIDNFAPQQEREKFIRLIKPKGTILDAGCGPGRDSQFFASQGYKVFGVDLSEKLLEFARKRSPSAVFLNQDLRTLDFAHSSFDGIWACASLLHLKRIEVSSVVKHFYDLLKPYGVLFVSLRKGKGEADITDTLSPQNSRHFVYFSPEEFMKILVNSGFTKNDVYTWNTLERGQPRESVDWISSFSVKSPL